MGAQPEDCIESNTFSLPNHESESLTAEESAERISQHFAEISQQYPPLDVNLLPTCVQTKIKTCLSPAKVEDYEVYNKIRAAKKPQSGVPNDLPPLIVKEFSPELAKPISRIINSIVKTGQWPYQWKLELVTPIAKVTLPETER